MFDMYMAGSHNVHVIQKGTDSSMIYLTGDTHRRFDRVEKFCNLVGSTADDILIILGDVGINFYGYDRDRELKTILSELPITLLCIHGNHEQRPESIDTYEETPWRGGMVFREPEFPNFLFAKDGEIYELCGWRCIAIGGAYSIDKKYRKRGLNWWEDEQPSDEIKARVETRLAEENWKVDAVLSHTCPLKYIPIEGFLPGFDQLDVDDSTERWLDTIEDKLTYDRWLCGHFHMYKTIDKMLFLYNDFVEMPQQSEEGG